MRKICLIAVALFASTAAHAEMSRGLIMTAAEAAPAPQPPAAVVQPAPQPAPATAPAPATTVFQTTNPQAQMVVKQLEDHGLIKAQPAPQPTQTQTVSQANIVTLPAPGQPAQVQVAQTPPVAAPQQAVAPVSQPQVVQTQSPQTAATPTVSAAKPVAHTHHESDEAKARRIAARYGIHW